MEYAGKNVFSEARGKWKCHWNPPTLVINQYFKQRAVTALKPGRIPGKLYKTCVCKCIGDLYATHSITVCATEEKCIQYMKYLQSKCACSLDVFTQQMAMVAAKKCIAFITRNPLDISACFKLPFLLYIYCALVTMRACILVETIHPLKHKHHLKLFIQYMDQIAKHRSEC